MLLAATLAAAASWCPAAYAGGAETPVSADLIEARRQLSAPSLRPVAFRISDQFYFADAVENSEAVKPLTKSPRPLRFRYVYDGSVGDADDYLTNTFTNALVVVNKGEIVLEAYRNGATAASRFQTFSLSKSVTSLLFGIALDDGAIDSVDDEVAAYVPELKGTAYGDVKLRDALLMKSGVDFQELGSDGNSTDQVMDFIDKVRIRNSMRCHEYAGSLQRKHPPGEVFNYASPETCVIAAVIEGATGQSLAAYASQRLWTPLGAESAAYWLMDGPPPHGRATASGGFGATARDLARIGVTLLNGGVFDGERVVSEAWIRTSTVPEGPEPVSEQEQWGYQHQWWTLVDSNAFAGHGVFGQFLYVDPDRDLVVVKLSYWPRAWDYELEYETMAGIHAMAEELAD